MAERNRGPFAAALRERRRAANLTQEELAERAGLSPQAISLLECGVRRTPRPSTVELLARALELDDVQRRALIAAACGDVGAEADEADEPRALPPEPRAGIPPDPIPHFIGREAELAELRRLLRQCGRVAIHGLGGVGKSQLAVRYLHQDRASYPDGAFWLRADHEENLLGDLASLAWRLGLPERQHTEQERQIEAALRWLSRRLRWVLVLDNVEPPVAEVVRRWVPPGLPGHLVVTSRTPLWSARLRLEPLPADVAERFLLARTGQRDAAAARAVGEAVGHLPLALEQAAAYLEVTGRDLASYADLLRTRTVELMREGRPEHYPRPVASTWQLSLERLTSERPQATALLRLCACVAPDDIPIDTLRTGAGELRDGARAALTDEIEFDRTITALRRYSLIERQGDGLRVHRLLQAVVLESLTGEQARDELAAAIRLLRAGFPDEPAARPERWPLCARLLAHVRTVRRLAGDRNVEPEALGWLLDRAGSYARARGEFELARTLAEDAVDMRQRALGVDHPDVATSFNNLALVRLNQGDLASAAAALERALAIRERALGPEHPDTAETLANLGVAQHALGTLAAARQRTERALAIRERVLGPDHPDVAVSVHNLAGILYQEGALAAARPLLARALATFERALGPEHPDTASCLHNLAGVIVRQGDLAAARPLLERALAIRKRVLGADHPYTARTLYMLADALHRKGGGEPAAIAVLARQSLATLERALGPDHAWTREAGALCAAAGGVRHEP